MFRLSFICTFNFRISNPDQLQVSEEPDGVLQFTHTYVVLNRGPSPLYNAVLYICLPVNNVAGESMITKEDVQVRRT